MTIKVKPLVWEHVLKCSELGTEPYDHAEGFGGSYVVEHRAAGHFDMWKPNLSNGDRFLTPEAAKAAAQADYEARILSAIEAVEEPPYVLQEAITEAEAVRQTFCLASPGTYEEFHAYLAGFDRAAGIFRKAIEPVDPATIRAEALREAAKVCADLGALHSDYALTGLPEQARIRGCAEAAFTQALSSIQISEPTRPY